MASARRFASSACTAAGRTSASTSSATGPISGHDGRTAVSRVCAPTSTLSSTLRLPNTRPCWNVRARPRAASCSAARPVTGSPAKAMLPDIRQLEAGHEIEERGLARTVRADDAHQLALGNVEIERVDGGDAAEPARQSPDFEQRSHCRLTPSRTGPAGLKRISTRSAMP